MRGAPDVDGPGEVGGVREDADVVDLVRLAGEGDRAAWDALVDRYASLVWSVCRRHRLIAADAEDVFQSVWLRLVERLRDLRNPAALPGWLATTTGRECLRVTRAGWREQAEEAFDLEIQAQHRQAMRTAFAQLPMRCQQLLSLLMEDPPVSYARISERLGMPIGGIGPSRARCLDRLRGCPVLAAYFGPVLDYGEGSGA